MTDIYISKFVRFFYRVWFILYEGKLLVKHTRRGWTLIVIIFSASEISGKQLQLLLWRFRNRSRMVLEWYRWILGKIGQNQDLWAQCFYMLLKPVHFWLVIKAVTFAATRVLMKSFRTRSRRRYWCLVCCLLNQWRRQELMEGVLLLSFPPPLPFSLPSLPSLSLPSPLLALPFPSPPLRSRAPLSQLGCLGSAVSSPAGSEAEPQPKTYLVHSRAVRKPLVAIILSITWNEKLD